MSKTLLFTIEDFKRDDAANNLINLWSYNYFNGHSRNCFTCNTYSSFCEKALEEQWNPDWGNFEFVIEKIKNTDKTFIDLSKFSSMNRWEIIDILIKKNKKN